VAHGALHNSIRRHFAETSTKDVGGYKSEMLARPLVSMSSSKRLRPQGGRAVRCNSLLPSIDNERREEGHLNSFSSERQEGIHEEESSEALC
jgi:hypothetical protein